MGGVRNSKDKAAEEATAGENHRLIAVGLVARLLQSLDAATRTRASADVHTQRAEAERLSTPTILLRQDLGAPDRSAKTATPSETHFGEPIPDGISAEVFREVVHRAPMDRVEELLGTDRCRQLLADQPVWGCESAAAGGQS